MGGSCSMAATCPALTAVECSQFIMLRVLRLAQDDPLVWQRALLKGEVRRSRTGWLAGIWYRP